MLPTLSLISCSSIPFPGLIRAVPSALIMTVIFIFHNILNSVARSTYLSVFSLASRSTLWPAETTNSTIWNVLYFLFNSTRSDMNWICLNIKTQDKFVLHSLGKILFCMVKMQSLAQFPMDHFTNSIVPFLEFFVS